MTLSRDDFMNLPDPFFGGVTPGLDISRLNELLVGPDPYAGDAEVALALLDLVRDDLNDFGTGGSGELTEPEMRLAIRVLCRVSERAGVPLTVPFRDHEGWRGWWLKNGGYNSYQARRDLLSGLFDEPYARLVAAHDRTLSSSLMDGVSPHETLGWPAVDTEIGELRRHFRNASTPQDFAAVGNDCVRTIEALSRLVYVHDEMGELSAPEPPVQSTKLRLDRYIEARLEGKENAELRAYARKTIELAQRVKHGHSPDRVEAGIVADAVIALANMLRRLQQ